MTLSLDAIHELEISEDYPSAIDQLELRLQKLPDDSETVIRLAFNLWYAVVENDRMMKELPTEEYAERFMDLFHHYRVEMQDNADFCWAFGQGIKMFWYNFPGATEELGQKLINHACDLDVIYKAFWQSTAQKDLSGRFKGRGILEKYYNIA